MRNTSLPGVSRRSILLSTATLFIASVTGARARTIAGGLPWEPNAGNPLTPVKIGPWEFFTGEEGRAMEALADRIIPPDPQTPGGKDSGCAVFVDRQLAGTVRPAGRPLSSAAVQDGSEKPGQPDRKPDPASNIARGWPRSIAPASRNMRASRSPSCPTATRTSVLKGIEAAISSSKASTENRSSNRPSRTCRWASSPTRSMAAIATWSRGR